MSNLIVKVLVSMLAKLVTERFFAKTTVYSLRALARKTDNKLDDQIVRAAAEALGVPLPVATVSPAQPVSKTP